jgi:putative ABC transport system substrate-binding protein
MFIRTVLGLMALLACTTLQAIEPAGNVQHKPVSAGSFAVVYPDLANPYRDIFNAIIEGIEERSRVPVRRLPLGAQTDAASVAGLLRGSDTRVVIALGRQGLKATAGLDRSIDVVAGGVLALPETEGRPADGRPADGRSITGISLTPDPALLFTRLKNLMPGAKRVIVIYNPQHNGWLMPQAAAAARSLGLELVAQEARDMGTAARLYSSAFATADGRRDAIWLPQDPTTVDDATLLPLVLKQAWSRGVPVFSSSLPHVRKGVLFALYPDNRELGRALAAKALALQAGEPPVPGLVPLQGVLMAVNLRTASHLGLSLDYQQQRRFDLVFPEP